MEYTAFPILLASRAPSQYTDRLFSFIISHAKYNILPYALKLGAFEKRFITFLHRYSYLNIVVISMIMDFLDGVPWWYYCQYTYTNMNIHTWFYIDIHTYIIHKRVCKQINSHITLLNCRKTSNISRTLVGIKIVAHSDVVGASPARRCSNYIFILDLTLGLNM